MSIDRRVSAQSRRRRVLLQSTSDITTESAAERRAAEKLREARRPTACYASHVHRRLRGRWFSLVPVRRTTVAACGVAIIGVAVLLTLLHWASVTWAPLAYEPELARLFRLDRPDSLGTWAKAFFLAAAAATSLLVYQLRRYKVDDYQGHYRIWRPVIVLIAVLSVDSVCNLVPWLGALIDAMLGRRLAMAGADWIRIVLTVGGGALALRLVAEVRKSKLALAMMLVAIMAFSVPLLSRLNLLDAAQLSGWIATTSAPLIASAALWVSIGGYLRMLFREVRGLDEALLAQRNEAAALRKLVAKDSETASAPPRRWFGRRESPSDSAGDAIDAKPARAARTASRTDAKVKADNPQRKSWFGRRQTSDAKTLPDSRSPHDPQTPAPEREQDTASKKAPAEPRRRWFALRKPKGDAQGDGAPKPAVAKPAVAAKPAPKPDDNVDQKAKKRSWFSRSRPTNTAEISKDTPVKPLPTRVEISKSAPSTQDAKPARKGLGGWLRRDPSPQPPAPANRPQPVPKATAAAKNSEDPDDDDEEINDDSLDWGSMNKSERRRMRKEIKRGGRAA